MALNRRPDPQPPLGGAAAIKFGKDVVASLDELDKRTGGNAGEIQNLRTAVAGASQAAGSAGAAAEQVTQAVQAIPAAPTGLVVNSSTAYFNALSSPKASVSLSWNEVTTLQDGTTPLTNAVKIENYQVWAGPAGSRVLLATVPATGTGTITASVTELSTGTTYDLVVCARTSTGVYGPFSSSVSTTTPNETTQPYAPTTPLIAADLGVISVRWDGQVLIGGVPSPTPNWISYIYAETANVVGGPYTRRGQILRGAGSIAIADLPVGATVFVRIVGVSTSGTVGLPSAASSITVTGVDLGTLEDDVAGAIQDAVDAATAAETAANGKNKIFRDTTPPDEDGTAVGDLWYQHDNAANLIGFWIWNGTLWAPQLITDTIVGNLDAGKITSGYIAAERIEAESISGEKITAGSITGDRLQANTITANEIASATITANEIAAGAITVTHLEAGVGGALDISANETITLVAGQVSDVQGDVDGVSDNLSEMQTYYQFGPSGAIVSMPDSPFATAIRNDRIEMLENGNVVSYWNAGQMHVDSLVAEEIVLGNHKIEKYGDGTVVRAI